MTRVKRDWRLNFRERRSSVVCSWGPYTLISVVLIHQCLLGLLVSAPSLLCDSRGFEPPHGRGKTTVSSTVERQRWQYMQQAGAGAHFLLFDHALISDSFMARPAV
jgi:hypothetical protein